MPPQRPPLFSFGRRYVECVQWELATTPIGGRTRCRPPTRRPSSPRPLFDGCVRPPHRPTDVCPKIVRNRRGIFRAGQTCPPACLPTYLNVLVEPGPHSTNDMAIGRVRTPTAGRWSRTFPSVSLVVLRPPPPPSQPPPIPHYGALSLSTRCRRDVDVYMNVHLSAASRKRSRTRLSFKFKICDRRYKVYVPT